MTERALYRSNDFLHNALVEKPYDKTVAEPVRANGHREQFAKRDYVQRGEIRFASLENRHAFAPCCPVERRHNAEFVTNTDDVICYIGIVKRRKSVWLRCYLEKRFTGFNLRQ